MNDQEKPLKVKGGFNDILKAAVSGNPKPKGEDEPTEGDSDSKEGDKEDEKG